MCRVLFSHRVCAQCAEQFLSLCAHAHSLFLPLLFKQGLVQTQQALLVERAAAALAAAPSRAAFAASTSAQMLRGGMIVCDAAAGAAVSEEPLSRSVGL